MRSQELLFAAGAALMIGLCAALLMVSGSSVSEAGVVDANEPKSQAPPVTEEPAPRGDLDKPIQVVDVRESPQSLDLTSGTVLGDIWLAASAVPKLQSISVTVQELRGRVEGEKRPPFQRTVNVPLGPGTPTFNVRDIPFSEHGFIVRASSPGLNGGQQVVRIDEKHPVQEVKLMISPGVACSVLLRDQDQGFVTDTEVTLFQAGGQPTHRGKTDNFGSVVFENVLAGDYLVYAGPVARPLAEPAELIVQPGTGNRSQGLTVVVPRGREVVVAVNDIRDHGIADAQVKVLATDKTRLSQLEAQTDYSGKATFPYLAPGRYQIDVFKPDFERRSTTLTVTEAEPVPQQSIRLVRLR